MFASDCPHEALQPHREEGGSGCPSMGASRRVRGGIGGCGVWGRDQSFQKQELSLRP